MTKRNTKLPRNVRIAETCDGEYMVLVNGFQWGGKIDTSGAGDRTFKSKSEAQDAYLTRTKGN